MKKNMYIEKLYEALTETEKKELLNLIEKSIDLKEEKANSESNLVELKPKKNKHYLFTTYFKSQNPERQKEYDFCVEKNKVADFDKIFLFVENRAEDIIAARQLENELNIAYSKFPSATIEVVIINSRPNFRHFFDFIFAHEFSNSINIIANTDIFFLNMQELDKCIHVLESGKSCFALTRWDYHHNRPSHLFETDDSQDTWIFNGNENLNLIENCDFPMGKLGCDNRLAYELQKAGFNVLNPSRTIKTFHLHDVAYRTYNSSDISSTVPKPYLLLEPTQI